MDKVLDAIASRLNVRVVVEKDSGIEQQDFSVTDEVKVSFKKELNNHLFTKLQEMEVGEHVEYSFDYGNIKPLGAILEYANDNLAEVLLRLPSLDNGETYVFPRHTYIRFTLAQRDKQTLTINPDMICLWLMEAYCNQ